MSALKAGLGSVLALLSAREAAILGGKKNSSRLWILVGFAAVLGIIFYLAIASSRKAAAAKKTGASAPASTGTGTFGQF